MESPINIDPDSKNILKMIFIFFQKNEIPSVDSTAINQAF